MKKNNIEISNVDQILLNQLQQDATLSMDRLSNHMGVSKTAAWNRVQKLQEQGVIKRQVAILDAAKIGLPETFFISIKTNQHQDSWLKKFVRVVKKHPEIVEVHRLAGDVDYLMKVQVASTRAFDELYKKLVGEIDIHEVTSSLSMEVVKQETALPVQLS